MFALNSLHDLLQYDPVAKLRIDLTKKWIENTYLYTSVRIYDQISNSNCRDKKHLMHGSGSLIEFDSKCYLITAAHCLFEEKGVIRKWESIVNRLFISLGKGLKKFPLSNNAIFRQVYLGNHESKEDDIAIFQVMIPPDNRNWHAINIKFTGIPNSSVAALKDSPEEINWGIAVGYPASLNKKYEKRNTRYDGFRKPKIACLRSEGIIYNLNNKILEKLEIIPDKNIVLYRGYGKMTEQGSEGSFISMNGLSGGALLIIPLLEEVVRPLENCFYFSGLVIESIQLGKEWYVISIPISEIFSKLS